MMSVPWPRMRGPDTLKIALVTASTTMMPTAIHFLPSIPPKRRRAFLKSFERSPGTAAELQRPAARCSGAERSTSSSE